MHATSVLPATAATPSPAHCAPKQASSDDNQFRRVERLFKEPLPLSTAAALCCLQGSSASPIDLTEVEPEALHMSRRKLKRLKSHLTPQRLAEIEHTWQQLIDVRTAAADNRWYTQPILDAPQTSTDEYSQHVFPSDARLHTFPAHPGFALLTNALSVQQQLRWAARCVRGFSTVQHSNLTNLLAQSSDATEEQYTELRTLWQRTLISHHQRRQQQQQQQQEECEASNDCKLDATSTAPRVLFEDFCKLRWTCLGYHYDWTRRSYAAEKRDAQFDPELDALCNTLARAAGCQAGVRCEAAIVNYYWAPPSAHTTGAGLVRDQDSSSMGGHVDDAELTTEQPIVSISLGNSAVFLLGGVTRATPPTAIVLRSGDVAIMGGQSRLCYHGVPRVIPNSFQPACADVDNFQRSGIDTVEQELVLEYLRSARLNINCRQVEDQHHRLRH